MKGFNDTKLSPDIRYSIDISDLNIPNIPISISEPNIPKILKEPKFKEGNSKSLF